MFETWFQSYQSGLFSDLESFNTNSISLEYLEPDKLYIKNSGLNSTFTNIKIDGRLCNINGTLTNGMNIIDLGVCTSAMEIGPKEVVLISSSSIKSKTLMLRSIYTGGISFSFQTSSICSAGYTRIFGIESLSNSHAETSTASNYTYSSCIKVDNISLSSSCSGNYTRLFYLDGFSNAHVYTDNTSPYESTWYEICLSVDSGSISSQISSTNPADGSVCVGSMEPMDNVTGVHIGDCNAYIDKIWLKIN